MKLFLALVVYRCSVNGKITDSLDFQVRWFSADSHDEVGNVLENEPPHSYDNPQGEAVTWSLSRVLAVEEVDSPESGDEVVGFIARIHEIACFAQPADRTDAAGQSEGREE